MIYLKKNINFRKNHQWTSSNVQQGQNKTGGQQWKTTGPTVTPTGAWNSAPMGTAAPMANPFANPFAAPMQPVNI